jgi:hypothetical protein
MRRILLIAMLGATIAIIPVGNAAASSKPSFKAGTYKAKVTTTTPFNITLKHARCGGKLQFCVSLPVSPQVECIGPILESAPIGKFTTPVALPSSGKLTEHAPISGPPTVPGETALTQGQSSFSITFTKKGTASGVLEESLAVMVAGQSAPCSGKLPFTAKLAP